VSLNVPFAFKAADKTFSAGTYTITAMKENKNTLSIRNSKTGEETTIPFITRLSPRDGTKGSVVFDKVNDQSYLSEIYLPGLDGFHLQGAPGEHTHAIFNADK
jgi:hypothetical protein